MIRAVDAETSATNKGHKCRGASGAPAEDLALYGVQCLCLPSAAEESVTQQGRPARGQHDGNFENDEPPGNSSGNF